jgi:hypothetical protein
MTTKKKCVLFWSRQLSEVVSLENIELWGKCEGRDGRPLYLMKVVWTQPGYFAFIFRLTSNKTVSTLLQKTILAKLPIGKLHWKTEKPDVNIGNFFYIYPMLEMFSGPWKEIFYIPACRKSLIPGATIRPTTEEIYLQHHGCQQQHAHGKEHMDVTAWTSATAGSPSTVTGDSRKATNGDVENLVLKQVINRGRSVAMVSEGIGS